VLLFTAFNLMGKKHQLWVKVNDSVTLRDIDLFLKNHWVECCGHMTLMKIMDVEFTYNTERKYNGQNNGEFTMKTPLSCINALDTYRLVYWYDMGSTTEIYIETVEKLQPNESNMSATTKSYSQSTSIEIIHENSPYEYKCDSCGDPAVFIEEYEPKCKSCIKDMELALSICNSPRMGICGYEK
jgi:hypothetical protein